VEAKHGGVVINVRSGDVNGCRVAGRSVSASARRELVLSEYVETSPSRRMAPEHVKCRASLRDDDF